MKYFRNWFSDISVDWSDILAFLLLTAKRLWSYIGKWRFPLMPRIYQVMIIPIIIAYYQDWIKITNMITIKLKYFSDILFDLLRLHNIDALYVYQLNMPTPTYSFTGDLLIAVNNAVLLRKWVQSINDQSINQFIRLLVSV